MTIEISIGLLIFLICTNALVWLVILFIAYAVAGFLDLTYHERHKETSAPYYIESEDERRNGEANVKK